MRAVKVWKINRVKKIPLFFAGLLIGSSATYFALVLKHREVHAQSVAVSAPPQFTATLYRFELNPEKLSRFDEWIRFEHAHQAETVATLEREKMYFEGIFRDRDREKDVIYWLAVQGQGGGHTDSSPLAIDKPYQTFMQDTLKKGSRTTLATEYTLVPSFVVAAICDHDQSCKKKSVQR